MPEINVLPKSVAELIAAGEVVERPASVVKELTENAIDAGATAVTVEIKKGGSLYIRVTDNGCGIPARDVPTAFLPHATSKIRTAQDLDSIFTLGFRGEALPSIASVSKVYMLTRTAEEEIGTAFTIEGGEQISLEEAGCPAGTTVVVRELFYNTPARMKFLKKDVTEGNFVSDVVTKTALSHPEIKFTFLRDEKRVFSTPGGGNLFAALHAVFGKEVTDLLLPCDYAYENIKLSGYISKPLGNRPNRSMQYFFVNGRFVRIPAAAPALDRAYKNSIMIGKFPMCFLSVELPFHLTDVNVHPAKTEIRFSDEAKIYEAVFYAARSAISKGDQARPGVSLTGKKSILEEPPAAEQLSFSAAPPQQKAEAPAPAQPQTAEPAHAASPTAASSSAATQASRFASSPFPAPRPQTGRANIDIAWSAPAGTLPLHSDTLKERLEREGYLDPPSPAPEAAESGSAAPAEATPPAPAKVPPQRDFAKEFAALSGKEKKEASGCRDVRVIGEAFKTYILAECGEKLLLIDKHAAHERMIFNSLSCGERNAQMLLSPVTVGLSGREFAAVMENLQVFTDAGYEIEEFGGSNVIVRACPAVLTKEDIASLVREMAGKLAQGDLNPVPEKLDWLMNSTACRAAVKAGDELKPAEMQHFVEKLLADDNVKYCPHGRPVLYELSKSELERRFGRQQ